MRAVTTTRPATARGLLGACMFGLTENQTGDPGLIVGGGASRRLSPVSASHRPLVPRPVQDVVRVLAAGWARHGGGTPFPVPQVQGLIEIPDVPVSEPTARHLRADVDDRALSLLDTLPASWCPDWHGDRSHFLPFRRRTSSNSLPVPEAVKVPPWPRPDLTATEPPHGPGNVTSDGRQRGQRG